MAASTPAAIVQSATTEGHRTILGTLGTLAALAESENIGAPAMVIIGEVASFSDTLSWFEPARARGAAR
jgi:siroheme synthase